MSRFSPACRCLSARTTRPAQAGRVEIGEDFTIDGSRRHALERETAKAFSLRRLYARTTAALDPAQPQSSRRADVVVEIPAEHDAAARRRPNRSPQRSAGAPICSGSIGKALLLLLPIEALAPHDEELLESRRSGGCAVGELEFPVPVLDLAGLGQHRVHIVLRPGLLSAAALSDIDVDGLAVLAHLPDPVDHRDVTVPHHEVEHLDVVRLPTSSVPNQYRQSRGSPPWYSVHSPL